VKRSPNGQAKARARVGQRPPSPLDAVAGENKRKEKKTLESARGPPRVLAHKVRRKLTTNAFEGTVSLLLRRDPESFSAAGR
jgi:hypothetical protein